MVTDDVNDEHESEQPDGGEEGDEGRHLCFVLGVETAGGIRAPRHLRALQVPW